MNVDGMGWKEVHARLTELAQKRASLDYEEAVLLIAARRWGMHERLGYASLIEYVERTLGHQAKVARERLRVADALDGLPRMAAALREGRLSWSAARELTRIAVADTEEEWLAAVQDKSVREIERRVSGYLPGDRPSDEPKEDARRHTLHLEISGATMALFREARDQLMRDSGAGVDDDAVIAQMARAVLGGPTDAGRASYQLAVMVCERCQRGFAQGGGERLAIDEAMVAKARCDGQHIGDVNAKLPAKATQDVAPAVRRIVMARDKQACVVPGCAQSVWVDVHHLDPREEQGAHDVDNLAVVCDAHHTAIHEGRLNVAGRPSAGLSFTHADGTTYGGKVSPAHAEAAGDAFLALRALGFKESEAKRAIAGTPHVGQDLDAILRGALKILSAGVAKVLPPTQPSW